MAMHRQKTEMPEDSGRQDAQNSRTVMLIGEEGVETLRRASVAVFGLGGVGSAAAEALARAGVGHLTLVDHDTVALSNLNRQILSTLETAGRPKTEVMAERIRSIDPEIRLTLKPVFFLPETAGEFDFSSYDAVIDAIDTVTGKIALIEAAKKAGTMVISAMGAGNKLDPSAFRVADISKTSVCPLAKVVRKELKKRGIEEVTVVYSEEKPRPIPKNADGPRTKAVPGSISFVPPVMGYILAGEVIRNLLGIRRDAE